MKKRSTVRRLSAAVTAGALSAIVLTGMAIAPRSGSH